MVSSFFHLSGNPIQSILKTLFSHIAVSLLFLQSSYFPSITRLLKHTLILCPLSSNNS
uniref:Uncharacterized protein n=1 Tax=Helianthus annuus TaxID=4232 RepID=A0A251V390_HELAN